MFGREELIWEFAEEFGNDLLYLSAKVDEVMDRMEARIKELEAKLVEQVTLKNYYKEICDGLAAEVRKKKRFG